MADTLLDDTDRAALKKYAIPSEPVQITYKCYKNDEESVHQVHMGPKFGLTKSIFAMVYGEKTTQRWFKAHPDTKRIIEFGSYKSDDQLNLPVPKKHGKSTSKELKKYMYFLRWGRFEQLLAQAYPEHYLEETEKYVKQRLSYTVRTFHRHAALLKPDVKMRFTNATKSLLAECILQLDDNNDNDKKSNKRQRNFYLFI
jgi:hypothetical protein